MQSLVIFLQQLTLIIAYSALIIATITAAWCFIIIVLRNARR